jgi:hypothetical protein
VASSVASLKQGTKLCMHNISLAFNAIYRGIHSVVFALLSMPYKEIFPVPEMYNY